MYEKNLPAKQSRSARWDLSLETMMRGTAWRTILLLLAEGDSIDESDDALVSDDSDEDVAWDDSESESDSMLRMAGRRRCQADSAYVVKSIDR